MASDDSKELLERIQTASAEENEFIEKNSISYDRLEPLIDILQSDKDSYYLMLANTVSSRSTCFGRQTGAIIIAPDHNDAIVAIGYNGAGPGIESCVEIGECVRRESKSSFENDVVQTFTQTDFTHLKANELEKVIRNIVQQSMHDQSQYLCKSICAEANTVLTAAQLGTSLEGTALYATLFPCDECAKDFVRVGIEAAYYWKDIGTSIKHSGKVSEEVMRMFQQRSIGAYQHEPSQDYRTAFSVFQRLFTRNGEQTMGEQIDGDTIKDISLIDALNISEGNMLPLMQILRSDYNSFYMTVARSLAARSNSHSNPCGSVIVRPGKPFIILAGGYSSATGEDNMCAEERAISDAGTLGRSIAGAHMYSTHIPCEDCAQEAAEQKIGSVMYWNPIPAHNGSNTTESCRDVFRKQRIPVYHQQPTDDFLSAFRIYQRLPVSEKRPIDIGNGH